MKTPFKTSLLDLEKVPVVSPDRSSTVLRPRCCASPVRSHFITGKQGPDSGQRKTVLQPSHPHKPDTPLWVCGYVPISHWDQWITMNGIWKLEFPWDTGYKAVLFPLGYEKPFHVKGTDSSSLHKWAQRTLVANSQRHRAAHCSILCHTHRAPTSEVSDIHTAQQAGRGLTSSRPHGCDVPTEATPATSSLPLLASATHHTLQFLWSRVGSAPCKAVVIPQQKWKIKTPSLIHHQYNPSSLGA